MRITGKTRIMFILGDPVGHIVGTAILNEAFEARGLDVAVSPLQVRPADLRDCLAMLRRIGNLAGFGVTIPHKIAVVPLLEELTPEARLAGAVNFVRRNGDGTLTGHNVDGAGFVGGLAAAGFAVARASVLQVGAGGVGRAIAASLAMAGAGEIRLLNRSRAKAESLAADLRAACVAAGRNCRIEVLAPGAAPALAKTDLLVNATSVGMHEGDPLPLDIATLTARTTVAEVIMSPPVTRLLQEAEARGCKVVAGVEMIKPQTALTASFLGF